MPVTYGSLEALLVFSGDEAMLTSTENDDLLMTLVLTMTLFHLVLKILMM